MSISGPMRHLALAALTVIALHAATAQENAATPAYGMEENILYRTGDGLTDYMRERCRLDVYYPTDLKDFPTVVWFHGGGLTGGNRFVPEGLKENAYLWRMMQVVGHPDTVLYEMDGYNHGQMAEPAHPLLLRFVKRVLAEEGK